ncbi:transketolase [Pseudoglutamicibacter albus]|uniref:Transketolase n=1 Tax=Pseudoglutamicibacter albus TaxID=98671 RepID=A0ABU1YYE8_9MICC|nr:transketolase [Pseudoglutamicibacter albus]MDR7293403.1 transketolase [Pseudoglutamicibacter albus]
MPSASQTFTWTQEDAAAVDTARVLAADAVEKVGNGHPGTAISLAPVAHLLFQKHIRHNPQDPQWAGRDRFILSPGHTSLTLYTQLFMTGYGLSLDDMKALRTWDALTPGHPEYGHTAGVEFTTGPLGQGLASAVGFAYAQRRMRRLFDKDAPAGESPFDHRIYVIASDGDLQEGVTSEASSLAGHQQLGQLVVIWDDNEISIEDDTNVAFTEDVEARYRAYGWHTQRVDWLRTGDYVEDMKALNEAIEAAKAETDRPSLIALRTVIGWPSPTKQNTGGIHGAKLGGDEVAGLKKAVGFDPERSFVVDDAVLTYTRKAQERGEQLRKKWDAAMEAWRARSEDDTVALYDRLEKGELPEGWTEALPHFEAGETIATRAASGKVINALAPVLPELWGGSADLAGSNNTFINGAKSFNPSTWATDTYEACPGGRNLHFGIREHAAGAIVNGIVTSSPTRAYSGTFLIFSDYMRPAVRLSALMGIPSIYVWTHDSIGLGEDGPTHQPVEQLASLRAIPNLDVIRPADANEVAVAWKKMLETTDHPTAIVLTRQGVETLPREEDGFAAAENAERGAYILREATRDGEDVTPDVILIGTGSEVGLAVEAQKTLAERGIAARVVSMPCIEWLRTQDAEYREKVLPPEVTARVAVEAAHPMSWYEWVGSNGRIVGLDHFGASADGDTLYRKFGITAEAVVEAAEALAAR